MKRVDCGLLSVDCGLWTVGCGEWKVESGLWTVGCGLWRVERVLRGLAVVLLLSTMPVVAGMAPVRLEPTVSAKEAGILADAAVVGATNATEAVALLRKRDLSKASAALDFAVGNFQFQTNLLAEAEVSYQDAITKLPTFRNARKNLGRVYLLGGQEAKAVTVCQALVEEGLADADVFLLLGHGLALQLHWVPAETAYRQALLLKTDSDDARSGLARCLVQQERYREARSLLRTMLESVPAREELWSLLANVNIALDESDDAIRALETARRLGCCSHSMLGLLGDLYLNAERAADAVASYEEAGMAGWRDHSRMLRAVEGLIMINEAAGAAAILDSLKGDARILADPVLELKQMRLEAELAALQGNTETAVTLFRVLIERDPLNGKALLRQGELLQEQGDLGGAELSYERAGRLEGVQVDALVKRAQLAVQRERFDAAVNLLEAAEAIESRPNVARYLTQVRRLAEQ